MPAKRKRRRTAATPPLQRALPRRWRTYLKQQASARRARVFGYQLSPHEIYGLLASSRQAGTVSMARAMGIPLKVPSHRMNPRSRPPGWLDPDERPTLTELPAIRVSEYQPRAAPMMTLADQRRLRQAMMAERRARQGQRLSAAMRTRSRRLQRQADLMGWQIIPHDLRLADLERAHHRTRKRNPRRSSMARRRNPARPGTQTYFRYGARRQGARPQKTRRVGMAARARARGFAGRREYMRPVQGPLMASGFFDPSSAVTMGRRARGRGRALVYGPVQSPSLYRAKRRKPRRRARASTRRRRTGRMPAGLARYWAAMGRRRRRRPARRAAPRKRRGRARRTYRYGYGRKLRRSPRRIRTARRRAHQRSRQHLRAIRTIRRGQRIAGRVVRNPYTGRMEFMPTALVANPRRRRRGHASNPGRRRRRRSRRFIAAGRIVMNPGGGFFGSAKAVAKNAIKPAMAALAGGAAVGFVASKISSPIFGALARAATGIAGAAFLRRHPAAAWSFFGATVGSFGTQIGASLGGGLVAFTKGSIFKGLADMASEDGEMAALLAGAGVEDIGDLVQVGDIADDDDALGDLVNEVAGLGDSDDEGVGDEDSDE